MSSDRTNLPCCLLPRYYPMSNKIFDDGKHSSPQFISYWPYQPEFRPLCGRWSLVSAEVAKNWDSFYRPLKWSTMISIHPHIYFTLPLSTTIQALVWIIISSFSRSSWKLREFLQAFVPARMIYSKWSWVHLTLPGIFTLFILVKFSLSMLYEITLSWHPNDIAAKMIIRVRR